MNIYWSLKSIPELAELSGKERKEIWLRCLAKTYRNWRTWLTGLAFTACVAVITYVLVQNLNYRVAALLSGLFGGIGALISFQFQARTVRPYIRRELKLPEEEIDQVSDWQRLLAKQRYDLPSTIDHLKLEELKPRQQMSVTDDNE